MPPRPTLPLVLVLAALPVPVAAAPSEVVITVHVAAGADGAPVADEAWIDAELATATARLGAADVAFTRAAGDGAGVPDQIASVADRDALAALADAGTIHVFVVDRLADKDDDGWINGVTWRYAGAERALRGRRYIVIARHDALVDTLGHELGHLFGLHHETDPDNLMMAPGRRDGATLDAGQLRIVRRRVAAWVRDHGRARP